MTDPTDRPPTTSRTWRPIALWSAAILLALGLAWLVGALGTPYLQARSAIQRVRGGGDQATQAIKGLGTPEAAVRKLMMYIRLRERLAPEWHTAVTMLGQYGEAAVPSLESLMRDPDANMRLSAMFSIRCTRSPRAMQPLLDALKDDACSVRQNAAEFLGDLRHDLAVIWLADLREREGIKAATARPAGSPEDGQCVQALIALLKEDYCRLQAARALGQFASSGATEAAEAADPLMALLKDEGDHVRAAAATSLGQIGDRRATEPLINVLGDRAAQVRAAAAGALGRIGDERALESLKSLLNDPDERVRAEASLAPNKDCRGVSERMSAPVQTELLPLPARPPRTWRPIALWTAGMLLALGLAWFVGAVVMPVWQTRSFLTSDEEYEDGAAINQGRWNLVQRLGGQEKAASKLHLYLRLAAFCASSSITSA